MIKDCYTEENLMKKRKFVIVFIVALFLIVGTLYAKGEAETSGETVVKFWRHQATAFNETYDMLAEQYMMENPDVKIVFEDFDYDTYIQTLQTAFPSGTEADIMSMFGTWINSYSGRLSEVPANLVAPGKAAEIFEPSTLGGYLVDGKLYGIPLETNIEYGAVLINKQIAKEVGADVSSFDDWDDFIAEMKKMTLIEDGVMNRAGYGFCHSDGIAYTFLSLIKQYGGFHMNATGDAFTFDTPEARKALKLMKRFVDEGLIDPVLFNDESNWAGDGFFTEIIGGIVLGPWVIGDYAADFPEVTSVAEYVDLPSVSGAPYYTAASGWGLTVSANSKVADTAWDIVNYFALNSENALTFNIHSGTVPALIANASGAAKEKLISEKPYLEAYVDLLPYGTYQGHMPDSDLVVYDILYNYILQYLQGNSSLEEAIKGIQADSQGTF